MLNAPLPNKPPAAYGALFASSALFGRVVGMLLCSSLAMLLPVSYLGDTAGALGARAFVSAAGGSIFVNCVFKWDAASSALSLPLSTECTASKYARETSG